ncbi:energy transducer TonB family protein [Sphingobium sp. CAP-1]|uniref:energy transducer TonB family protein n=1 Tax=Sphingobium sp. CAP-1 TaxID=2676077 RepID=UPI0012BB252C|nr:energy transducer TonB [Sphingobium sp. CAP-1]QGP80467.1 TonB family protein [Sphingobium sp. CAP-1]
MTSDPKEETGGLRRFAVPVILLAVMVALGLWVWSGMDSRTGVARPPQPATTVDLLPPPPPPPPPPPDEVKPPEPTEAPTPDPTPSPSPDPTPEAPAPMSINAPATAGSDAFGMQAGSGGGMGSPGSTGTCIGPNCGHGAGGGGISDTFYRQYLSAALQNALRRDKAINRERFTMTVLIWVDGSGRVTRAEAVDGTGDATLDQKVVASLRTVASLRAPQPGIQFPQRTVVRGTRS